MPTLAIDKGFLSDLVKLEKPVAKRVTDVFNKFEAATHTGIHLETIANAATRGSRPSVSTRPGGASCWLPSPATSTPC